MRATALSHLAAPFRAQAELDDVTRIQVLLRDRWIDYPRATHVLQRLDRLLQTPECGAAIRMRGARQSR